MAAAYAAFSRWWVQRYLVTHRSESIEAGRLFLLEQSNLIDGVDGLRLGIDVPYRGRW